MTLLVIIHLYGRESRLVTVCIRRKSCVIQTGKSKFKSLYRASPTPISIKGSTFFNLPYIIRSGARQIFPGGWTDCSVHHVSSSNCQYASQKRCAANLISAGIIPISTHDCYCTCSHKVLWMSCINSVCPIAWQLYWAKPCFIKTKVIYYSLFNMRWLSAQEECPSQVWCEILQLFPKHFKKQVDHSVPFQHCKWNELHLHEPAW